METIRYAPIPGYPKYQAGEDGNIRREVSPGVWLANTPIRKKRDGYLVTTLFTSEGKKVQRFIARLILLAFVGQPQVGQEECHNNGLRFDNRLENLRWDTQSGNEMDKRKHGTSLKGERNHQHRLVENEVREIKNLLNRGINKTDIAHKYGVSSTAIYWIAIGRNWPSV